MHAIWDQLLLLRRLFPGRFGAAGIPDRNLPLFPNNGGGVVPKLKMTETIVHAGRFLGTPRTSLDEACRLSGHSLRVTGAHGLTRRGLDLFTVQLLGRWGSSAVQSYVRGAHLQEASRRAARSALAASLDLDLVVERVLRRLRAHNAGVGAAVEAAADAGELGPCQPTNAPPLSMRYEHRWRAPEHRSGRAFEMTSAGSCIWCLIMQVARNVPDY